ncbi:MAG: class I tRNA ligase family protein, partial [Candidatus Omnitrophica bacterium]|nr:class I tRNA ligase family protein [Candidatus Omnitrophota bacterium]
QKSRQRLSSQYVLSQLLEILIQLISPILSFTAEEAYLAWDGLGGKKASIFLTEFDPKKTESWLDRELLKKWSKILDFRVSVLKEIEKKREEGTIGSSLDAEIEITCSKEQFSCLDSISHTLKEIFIVSDVKLKEGPKDIKVNRANGAKCPRCWNWSQNPQDFEQFKGICPKCINSLKEARR